MKFICGFIVAAFLVASSHHATPPPPPPTPVKECADGPLPEEVRIHGCDKVPCHLIRGKNVTAQWDFVVKEDTNALKPRVRATVFGATVNYPFPQKDACASLKDVKCPLKAGQNVTYALSMPILKQYPKVPLVIEFAFLNDSGTVAVCFKVQAKVADK